MAAVKRSKTKRNEPRLTETKLSKGSKVKLYSLSGMPVDAFLLFDEDLNLLSINEAGQKMFGVSQAGVFGKCILDIIRDVKDTRIYKSYRQVLKTGKSIAAHLELGGRHLSIQVFKQGDALGMIACDITERKKTEEALKVSEERYRYLFHNAEVALFRSRIADGKILECNDLLAKLFGYDSREQCLAEHVTSEHYVDPNVRALKLTQMLEKGKAENFEAQVTRRDGSPFWVSFSARIYPERDCIEGAIIDITERKRAEEELQASLKEKEALLREVNHRVKNNFQLITGILDMVGMRARNEEAVRLIGSVHSRVHAMARVHSQLYKSDSFAQIDMGAYLGELVGYLAQAYAVNGKVITPVLDATDVYLPITQAVPCALVLNEVLSNSFKHAFVGRERGRIEIAIRKSPDGTVYIAVRDDGVGVPETFDIEKVDTLGLKLARNLVQEQLKGKLQIRRDRGTEVAIEFRGGL